MVTRRRALHAAGAGIFGLAGCASRDRGGTPTASQAPPTTTSPADTTESPTTATPTERPDPTDEVDVEGASPSWTRALGASIRSPPVYASGYVVAVAGETIYGLDAASGETVWTFGSPVVPGVDAAWVDATLQVDGGIVYALVGATGGLGGGDYALLALRPDGTEKWQYTSDLSRVHEIAGVGGGAVVLPTHDDDFADGEEEVLAIDLDDGEERWRAKAGDSIFGAVGDSVAAVHLPDSALDCFDLETGDRRFRFEVDESTDIRSTAVGDGLVFVGVVRDNGTGPTLYALDSANGEAVWTSNESRVEALRYLDDLYVGGGAILRLSSDGSERWRYDGGGLPTDVLFDDDLLYTPDDSLYTNAGSRLISIRRRDGHERWAGESTDTAIPRAHDADAIVSTARAGNTTFAHAADDGTERWRAIGPDDVGSHLAAGGGGAYLATERGSVLKIPL